MPRKMKPKKVAKKSKMYADTKTWNPFVGCKFDCTYCKKSFQVQLKRRGKEKDPDCYYYRPHEHPERLQKIPSRENVFVVGTGDISFCHPEYTRKIIQRIKEQNKQSPGRTYYFQSKNPKYFKQFLKVFPDNVILLTTLETNRDEGYGKTSKAPKPSVRYQDFLDLDYPRKVVTIEPVMDFDLRIFSQWITKIKPEYVWFGFNSRPKQLELPEPSAQKAQRFLDTLKQRRIRSRLHNIERKGIEIRGKELRGLTT